MLTNEEYCAVSDLASVRHIKAVLKDIIPEMYKDAIEREDHNAMMQKLFQWEEQLVAKIEISEEEDEEDNS